MDGIARRVALFFLAAAAYAVCFWPSPLDAASAGVFFVLWSLLARAGWRPRLQAGAFHAPRVDAWNAALGFWPAALLSSIAFAAIAIIWAWAGKRSGGLVAPDTAHMALDWVMDPII
jgi:hypothetical protein